MSDCFDLTIIDQLRADLARVTAELKAVSLSAFTSIKNGSETMDALRSKIAEYDTECTRLTDRVSSLEMERAALRARVVELEGALESIAAGDGDERRRAEDALASAESAAPANQSPAIDAESLIAACIPGGSICDPQSAADAIREYLRTPAPHVDTVRLDWLDEVNQQINRQHGTVYGYRCDVNHNRAEVSLNDSRIPALTVRAAIDAAMKGGAND